MGNWPPLVFSYLPKCGEKLLTKLSQVGLDVEKLTSEMIIRDLAKFEFNPQECTVFLNDRLGFDRNRIVAIINKDKNEGIIIVDDYSCYSEISLIGDQNVLFPVIRLLIASGAKKKWGNIGIKKCYIINTFEEYSFLLKAIRENPLFDLKQERINNINFEIEANWNGVKFSFFSGPAFLSLDSEKLNYYFSYNYHWNFLKWKKIHFGIEELNLLVKLINCKIVFPP